jgi:CubicO group peptidase (beta-lactamase class C family)
MRRFLWCVTLLGFAVGFGLTGQLFSSEPPPPKMPAPKSADAPATKQTEKPAEKPAPAPPAKPAASTRAKPSEAVPSKLAVPAKPSPKPHAVGEANELEAFFDGAIGVQLEAKHIAGAVVAVVVGDKVVFAKGYGFADVESLKPVDPNTTMFRIGSVSKLFTWTAVMQLVEEGKLDLDTDVNTYLKSTGVHVPEGFGKPITLKNLLTHTPGFEDRVIGLFAHHASAVKPLADVLKNDMPARIRPPGVLAAYSNHGSALAGLVVATVAGKPWEDVIEQRILIPLGMKNTLVRQPDKPPETMSKGYKWKEGQFKEEGFEYVPLAPAGAMSASAADMCRFMIAHLNDGKCESTQILKPETTHRMRERLFAHDPKVDAMCYGFWELNQNGQRIIDHGGDTLVFHSLLAMIPEHKVGLFLSYNTDQGARDRDDVLDAFLNRYYPVSPQSPPKSTADAQALKRFDGEYAITRHSQTTYAKLAELMQYLSVKANSDGTLSIGGGEDARRYAQVEPLVFQEVGGRRKVVFHEDDQGRITDVFLAAVPAIAGVRQTGLDDPRLHQGVLAGCVFLFATALVFWPVLAFARRGSKSIRFRRSFLSGLISCIAWLLSAASLIFLCGLLWGLHEPEQVVYGTPREIEYLLLVPQVCAGLAAITFLCSIIAWSRRYWRFSGRVHYTLVAFAGVAFVWFLYYWNLLKFGAEILITKS